MECSYLRITNVCLSSSQRNNLHHQKLGEKHVCLKFPEEASLSGFTEELYCEARDGNEAVLTDVIVCEKYAVSLLFGSFFVKALHEVVMLNF